jgi:hypothetical protein
LCAERCRYGGHLESGLTCDPEALRDFGGDKASFGGCSLVSEGSVYAYDGPSQSGAAHELLDRGPHHGFSGLLGLQAVPGDSSEEVGLIYNII